MDYELSEDQAAFRDVARQFSDRQLAPNAADWDANKTFPRDVIKAAGDLGFCGLYCPESAGGLGLSRLDSSIILEQLSMGCTSTTAFISIHNMATWMVTEFGSTELVEAIAPGLISGEHLASYCLTEPGAGSDAASLRTQAVVDGDDYIINGSKMFISGAGDTDYLVTMLRTGGPGPKGISCVVIPSGTEGIQFGHNLHKMGWNSQPTREIVFDNVRVPIGHRLGEEGDGFKIAMKGLDGGRINIGTCSVGTAQAALNRAKSYMSERQQFGEPLSNFQALQFKLADMATELVAARQMIRMAASRVDAGHSEATVYAAMAKQFATDVGFKVCNEALQIHGGYGYMQEYPLERHIRDTRVHQILEGTNEIMRVITARRLLALTDIEAIQ